MIMMDFWQPEIIAENAVKSCRQRRMTCWLIFLNHEAKFNLLTQQQIYYLFLVRNKCVELSSVPCRLIQLQHSPLK